ncbi:N-acetyl-gamma-glutamyl-phosphate reductase [Sphingomonas sp. 10B4]|uniref:N-acetyl-gamma-glutamyl-phosphate reductase n=1 Tax=Sphingomonas sp. 10B4 TaxID=3048575 RepID=UPI002AB47CF5|nr:N-acetyl-gamma-glutamyl-phosphate reductase [Sphingomonas sp. 10B4]MDY7525962.1 N-acetyl-gamma-glutamyl-phosphate reductase [Sphingomonas sp. 10B4]MEB0283176.1 N-acetyl-gamma-glutamyl-phosphate reductase [Sphingomonas sp. 10B4]
MSVSVFIDGAAGTTGLEIRERLAGRDDIAIVLLDEARRKDPVARAEALNDSDFVILCLPDDAAREAVSLIANSRTRVIDASTAFRVAEGWTYGFAEVEPGQANAIAEAKRVSNPGCYPTGFLALLRPLVRAGLVPVDWGITVNAVSGYSGGGKAMIAEYEGVNPPPATRAYALGLAHKHVPEMQKHARLEHPPIFTPSVANTYRGMSVEVPLALYRFPRRPTLLACETALREAYPEGGLIRIADGDASAVQIEDDAGTDRLTLRVCGNAETGQARLIATLDNLGKGAAGAAVQNLNIMAGLDPLAGLTV